MLAIILSIVAVIVSSVALFRVYQTRPLTHTHDFRWKEEKFQKFDGTSLIMEYMINVGTCQSCGFVKYVRTMP